MKINWIKQAFIALFLILVMISCEYDYIEFAAPPPPLPPDTNDTNVHYVSFANVIEPIFTTATCVNCHNGGLSLVLTPGNAYNSITGLGLVTPGDPASSKIYTYPHPVTGSHATKYQNNAQADSIYVWIYQGALNN